MPFEIRIDDAISQRLPGLSLVAMRFSGATVGAANRKIEPLRERVIAVARDYLTAAREPRRLPALATFLRAFPEMQRLVPRPWIDETLRGIARRDPFPVVNDAIDVARLLALHYAVPVAIHDLAGLAPPVMLRLAPDGTTIKTVAGAVVDLSGLPSLWDAGGALGSPLYETTRAVPTRRTNQLLIVACDPGLDPPLDAADLKTRASNWISSITGARPLDA